MKANPGRFERITWRGSPIDDEDILAAIPVGLFEVLREMNGFVLGNGVLHVRGACTVPDWHSLGQAWRGESCFGNFYDRVEAEDIPFAQDSFGDQFLLRDSAVWRLFAETGEVEEMAADLDEFWRGVREDAEGYLNVPTADLAPGQLLLAYPPYCVGDTEREVGLTKLPAAQVIRFHATLAAQLKDVPEGAKIKFNIQ